VSEGKPQHEFITVEALFTENKKRLKLSLLTKKVGFDRKITEKEIHRPGLALAGFTDLFTFHRVQVCGNTENQYLKNLTKQQRVESLKRVFHFEIPCFIVTSEEEIPPEIVEQADAGHVSVFRTPFATTKLVQLLGEYLDEKFAPQVFLHGSMVDVYGIGVLIGGRSGIGKSEVALDLIARGHQMIADDIVTVSRRAGGALIAQVNDQLRYNMEIRGLGIIDIQSMFGIRGIRKQKRLEVQVELVDWDSTEKYERLGLKEMTCKILDEAITLVRLPIYPGKNISMIVEVIALNQRLKSFGYHAAIEFEKQMNRRMTHGKSEIKPLEPFFE